VVVGPRPGFGGLVLFLLAAATSLPSVALAQILTPWPFLPIEITPSVGVEERYTDNFFQSKVRVEEFRTSILPGLSIGVSTGRNRSDIKYTLQVADSTVRKDNPQFFHFLNGTSRFSITDRIFLTLQESLTITDDPAVADARGLQRSVSRSNAQVTAVSVAYEGDLHGGSLDYTRTSVTREVESANVFTSSAASAANGTANGQTFESSINAFGASGRLSLGQRMVLRGRATYTEAEFTNPPTTSSQVPFSSGFTGYDARLELTREFPNDLVVTGIGSWSLRKPTGGQDGEDLTIWRPQLAATRPITPSIFADLNVGYDVVQGAVEFSGPSGRARVTYVGPNILASLSGGQAVGETFAQTVNVGLVQTRDVSLSVGYYPTDRLQFNLLGSLVSTEFLQPAVAASQGVTANTTSTQPNSTFYTLSASVTMRLSKVFALYLAYDYRARDIEDQKGTQPAGSTLTNFDSNTFTVRLTATYQ
jgi:hypothetical protein